MKRFQALLAVALCGALFGICVQVSAQTAGSGCATVVRVEGLASYSLGDDKWIPLVSGKLLPAGAVIRTGHNGVVDIVLGKDINLPQLEEQTRWQPEHISPDPVSNVRGMVPFRPAAEQNVVRLSPNTTLGIDKLTVTDTGADTVSDTELDLKKGKIYASVKKLTGASQYLIKLPSGIAGVRGTQFSITENGATSVYHSDNGGVVLSLIPPSGAPQTTIVGPGFSFDPTTGQLTIMPGDEQTFLDRLFTALQTIYSPTSFVIGDNTRIYISPVHGGRGRGDGSGGGHGGPG